MEIAPGADHPHAPGAGTWAESWTFDFAREDGLGGFVRLALVPGEARARYWAYIVGADIGLVAVRDHDVPMPRRVGADLEVRADSLWAEVVCETPLEHWGLGLEAFGLRFDDADDERDEVGERVAVGLDLEWEILGPAWGDAPDAAGRYSQPGIVHGELLVGPDRFPFAGAGVRDHSWGPGDAWSAPGRQRGGLCFGEILACELVARAEATSGWVWRLGEPVDPVTGAIVEARRGPDGTPTAVRWVLDHDLEVAADVLAVANVRLDAPAGHPTHRCRALCRATASGDGAATGAGWLDWSSGETPS